MATYPPIAPPTAASGAAQPPGQSQLVVENRTFLLFHNTTKRFETLHWYKLFTLTPTLENSAENAPEHLRQLLSDPQHPAAQAAASPTWESMQRLMGRQVAFPPAASGPRSKKEHLHLVSSSVRPYHPR